MENGVGWKVVAIDGVIGVSGTPKLIYGLCVQTDAADATVVLRDGTADTATAVITSTTTSGANSGQLFQFGGVGIMFPNGCFADLDANTLEVAVYYQEVI
jgi:hypothetical protein